MIRVLLMIAVAGFVLSLGCLSAAFAIGGPEAVARGGWEISPNWKDGRWSWSGHGGRHPGGPARGPETTRTLAWSGSDTLDIDLPAQVRYVQQAGPASVTVTGPKGAVEHVVVRDDSLRYDHGGAPWGQRISVVVRAPNIKTFRLSGANALTIEGYSQDRLSLDVSGAAEVKATGRADTIDLDISGRGDVDLGGLAAKGAEVDISGAGDATVAPTDWARLDISGLGDIRLLTHPKRLETNISGAGVIRQDDQPDGEAAPAPPVKGAKT